MKVDRFDIDVGIEGVLIEENRAACMVGHMEPFLKNVMIDIVRCFLQGINLLFPRNLLLQCVFPPTSGPRVVMADFGQTDFGQNRLWPKPTLANCGLDRLWPILVF